MQTTCRYPKRLRRLRLLYAARNSYFLTICVKAHRPILINEAVHSRLRNFIAESTARYGIWVNSYVLMPEHAHLIVVTSGNAIRIGEWVKALKAYVAQRKFRWQSGFFDHVLRSDDSRSEKWSYIRMNPVRRGLVSRPEDWPFAAAFHSMSGREL